MSRVARSAAVGLLCLLGGFVLGRISAHAPEHDESVRVVHVEVPADAQPTTRTRVATGDPARQAESPGRPGAGGSTAEAPAGNAATGVSQHGTGDAHRDDESTEDWTADDYLRELRAAANGTPNVSVYRHVQELHSKFPGTRISPEFALDLARAGYGFGTDTICATWSDAEILSSLSVAARSTSAEPLDFRFASSSAQVALRRDLRVGRSASLSLMSHDAPAMRRVGMWLSEPLPDRPYDRIEEIAERDPDADVRSVAMEILLLRSEDVDDGLRQLVIDALTQGPVDDRLAFTYLLDYLGDVGGRVALDLVRGGGFTEGDDALYDLTRAIVEAGLTAEALDAQPSRAVVRELAAGLLDMDEERPELVSAVAHRLDELVASVDTEDLDWVLSSFAEMGYPGPTEQLVRDTTADAMRRSYAFDVLWNASVDFDTEDDPIVDASFVAIGREFFVDPTAPIELRRSAFSAVKALSGRSLEPMLSDVRRVLADRATPPGLRATIVTELHWELDDDGMEEHYDALMAIWRNVAENDPSNWVRAQAEQMVRDTEDGYGED